MSHMVYFLFRYIYKDIEVPQSGHKVVIITKFSVSSIVHSVKTESIA